MAFVELLSTRQQDVSPPSESRHSVNGANAGSGAGHHPRLNRLLEHSWPIQEHLKNENSEKLFNWIGGCVAHVVRKGCEAFDLSPDDELPMGVTFSFPMNQTSLSSATLMAMGKGFAITSTLDLGGQLLQGYEAHRGGEGELPPIKIAAIANDAVSTLVSFVYQFSTAAARGPHQKAAMGLIVGTGCNATIPLKLSSLHESKRPASISVLQHDSHATDDVRIAVNTEWSINGSAPPLRKLGLISRWDEQLDRAGEYPGFQPLEYMTAGRYLGELARLIFVDYLSSAMGVSLGSFPEKLRQRFGLTTTFISHFYPGSPKGDILGQLGREFPVPDTGSFGWTQPTAEALYRIARAIQVRAAGIVAAATVGLLRCAEEIPDDFATYSSSIPTGGEQNKQNGETIPTRTTKEVAVGYTGGCIQFFQDYLLDTQRFLDEIVELEYRAALQKRQQQQQGTDAVNSGKPPVRIILVPCHDGGITGAGILVPSALMSEEAAAVAAARRITGS